MGLNRYDDVPTYTGPHKMDGSRECRQVTFIERILHNFPTHHDWFKFKYV